MAVQNPSSTSPPEDTRIQPLLAAARAGDGAAAGELFALLYRDLRRLARARLHHDGNAGQQLDTTMLVHESFERFARLARLDVADRGHFMAYASRVMRSVIVDSARERLADRRGGGLPALTLSTELLDSLPDGEEMILDVHEALEVLAKADARLAHVVEMRYFGGYSEAEIGETLGVTERTVRRDWEKARLLLGAILEH